MWICFIFVSTFQNNRVYWHISYFGRMELNRTRLKTLKYLARSRKSPTFHLNLIETFVNWKTTNLLFLATLFLYVIAKMAKASALCSRCEKGRPIKHNLKPSADCVHPSRVINGKYHYHITYNMNLPYIKALVNGVWWFMDISNIRRHPFQHLINSFK